VRISLPSDLKSMLEPLGGAYLGKEKHMTELWRTSRTKYSKLDLFSRGNACGDKTVATLSWGPNAGLNGKERDAGSKRKSKAAAALRSMPPRDRRKGSESHWQRTTGEGVR